MQRDISDYEFDNIIASWWRNKRYDKLKALKKIEALFKSKKASISNADKLERVNNLTK